MIDRSCSAARRSSRPVDDEGELRQPVDGAELAGVAVGAVSADRRITAQSYLI